MTAAPRRWPLGRFARVAVLALLLALVYHRALAKLAEVWRTNESYSHGPLVPIVVLALLWLRRRAIAAVPPAPDARGLVLVVLACVALVAGMRADLFALEGYSLLLMVFGLAISYQGIPRLRKLAVPLGYLIFMLPFPPVIVNELSFALKEITVRLSTTLAEQLGVLVQRNGMSLWLQGGELRVENPCSGLRSLIALLATGALFAIFQPGGPWRRITMFLSAIPVAMFSNVLRITLLLVVGHYLSVQQAGGRAHDWSGVVLYAASLIGLLSVRWWLSPRARRPRTDRQPAVFAR
ncbi:MAG: exosortase/archaeosortase family protein [Candidatus Eisenbacteria bacterium]|uniref:Exosortase/archaeosortase family protein n=1 Tax=Eiseniibacteriota bacterium TaxID=2212470 RepID=A0A849SLQ4_UNCEI|nr:exosortase/archaeosortase family protein [Candidatus Eisenbacteria bacterium]